MKLKILTRTNNEIKLEIEGEGHSFCNALQKVLLNEETVDTSGYTIAHPLTANPVVHVRTLRGRPETALRAAAEKLEKKNRQFDEAFEKALKEWSQKQS